MAIVKNNPPKKTTDKLHLNTKVPKSKIRVRKAPHLLSLSNEEKPVIKKQIATDLSSSIASLEVKDIAIGSSNDDSTIDIDTLLSSCKLPHPVHLLSKVVPAFRPTKWDSFNESHFPSLDIIITNIKHYENVIQMTYFSTVSADNKKIRLIVCNVPTDFKVTPCDANTSKILLSAFKDWQIDNLKDNLFHNFSVGSDPEIFVETKEGKLIPAFNFLGSKKFPNRTAIGTYGSLPMYWDGYQAEFETSPQNCLAWQVDSVQCGLKGVLDAARDKFPNAQLSTKTVVELSYDDIHDAGAEHVEFGCTPSLNAYGIKVDMLSGREVYFRSAGGHIHFGMGKLTQEKATPIVKALDAILGVACVGMFAEFDNPKRRTMYGLPGEYRLPPHGLEYRTLSNAWLFHPMIMNLVFDMARKIVVFGESGLLKYWQGSEEETVNTIIKCDVVKARKILASEINKKIMCGILMAAYPYLTKLDMENILNIFQNGMESVIKDPNDIVNNWNLNDKWVAHSDGKYKNVLHSYKDLTTHDIKIL